MPSSGIAVIALIAAFIPGLAYHRAYTRAAPRDPRTSTMEIVELFGTGVITTFLGFIAALGLAEVVPGLINVYELTSAPMSMRQQPWSWITSVTGVIVFSILLSIALGLWLGSRSQERQGRGTRQGLTVTRAITERDENGTLPFLSIELSDGRLVEGSLRYASTDPAPEKRDIVLQQPVAWSGPGTSPRKRSPATVVVIPGALVRVIHVTHPPVKSPATGATAT